jgi:hypothetical protein
LFSSLLKGEKIQNLGAVGQSFLLCTEYPARSARAKSFISSRVQTASAKWPILYELVCINLWSHMSISRSFSPCLLRNSHDIHHISFPFFLSYPSLYLSVSFSFCFMFFHSCHEPSTMADQLNRWRAWCVDGEKAGCHQMATQHPKKYYQTKTYNGQMC